jgi:hypothetical protein
MLRNRSRLSAVPAWARRNLSTGGEVANALVCKTSIRRFNPGPVLHVIRIHVVGLNRGDVGTQNSNY